MRSQITPGNNFCGTIDSQLATSPPNGALVLPAAHSQLCAPAEQPRTLQSSPTHSALPCLSPSGVRAGQGQRIGNRFDPEPASKNGNGGYSLPACNGERLLRLCTSCTPASCMPCMLLLTPTGAGRPPSLTPQQSTWPSPVQLALQHLCQRVSSTTNTVPSPSRAQSLAQASPARSAAPQAPVYTSKPGSMSARAHHRPSFAALAPSHLPKDDTPHCPSSHSSTSSRTVPPARYAAQPCQRSQAVAECRVPRLCR